MRSCKLASQMGDAAKELPVASVSHVDTCEIAHSLCSCCKAQRRQRLREMNSARRARDQKRRATISTERILQDSRESGITVWHVRSSVGQCVDDMAEGTQ